jgi:hypothetical protein
MSKDGYLFHSGGIDDAAKNNVREQVICFICCEQSDKAIRVENY